MSDQANIINGYIAELTSVLSTFPVEKILEIITVIEEARQKEATIFICGNGGSWATAAHMVCDFGKNTRTPGSKRMRVIGLGDNIPGLTAYANDEGYDNVFAEPILSLMKPSDVLIAISGSGNSPNILRAVEAARERKGITIGLTGFKGGLLVDSVDYCLVIPSDSIEVVEDCHMILDHVLTLCLTS